MADNEIRTLVPLPDEAVALSVVEVVEYLAPDGERVYAFRHAGTDTISGTIGLLELAKRRITNLAHFDDE